jgi:putative spermidine/putrescine transport system permease protein
MTRWPSALGWLVLLGLLAPVLHTAWVSFSPDSFLTPPTGEWSLRWYRKFAEDSRWSAAVGRSLFVAAMSAGVSVAAAVPAAYAVKRARWRGRGVLLVSLLLPAAIPPAALGMGVLPLLHRAGLWGHPLGLILVHATLGLPVAFLIVRTHLTDRLAELESAARGLGANRWQVAWRVSLPLLRPALAAAGVAVFVLSVNEAFVTLFLASPNTETVPAVSWPELRHSPTPVLAVASAVTAGLGAIGMVIGIRLFGRPAR